MKILPTTLTLIISLLAVGCTSPDETLVAPSPDKAEDLVTKLQRPGVMPKTDGVEEFSLRHPSAPAGAHLSYFGGRVNSATQVVEVLWGTGSYESNVTSAATPSIATFYSQLLAQSTYANWLDASTTRSRRPRPAKTNQHINDGAFVNQVTITPASSASTITDASDPDRDRRADQPAGHPARADQATPQGNNDTYYAMFFPHGKTITQGGSKSCQAGGFCAYHGTIRIGSPRASTTACIPDMQPAPAATPAAATPRRRSATRPRSPRTR